MENSLKVRSILSLTLAALLACLAMGMAGAEQDRVLPTQKTMEQVAKIVYPEVVEGFLPVFFHSTAGGKKIAITIDDCNQPDNLREMIDLFARYGEHATIFPIGENVEFNTKVLQYAYGKGFEIENHTWTHSGLYYETDEEMARQIWDQNQAVGKALGVRYQMHFLRPRGGDNRYDQRTHAYLRQLGYYGIAYWDRVALDNTPATLAKKVKGGDVILYHTTAEDLEHMKKLVPALHKAGYHFVTLNELFGLPANETGEWTGVQPVEAPLPYERFPQILRKEDYLHDVFLVQERLSQLGFLTGNYNGYYGDRTVAAVRAFQQANNLQADGLCGEQTWRALFPEG